MFSRRDKSISKAAVHSSCTVLLVTAVRQVTSFALKKHGIGDPIRRLGAECGAFPLHGGKSLNVLSAGILNNNNPRRLSRPLRASPK